MSEAPGISAIVAEEPRTSGVWVRQECRGGRRNGRV